MMISHQAFGKTMGLVLIMMIVMIMTIMMIMMVMIVIYHCDGNDD